MEPPRIPSSDGKSEDLVICTVLAIKIGRALSDVSMTPEIEEYSTLSFLDRRRAAFYDIKITHISIFHKLICIIVAFIDCSLY